MQGWNTAGLARASTAVSSGTSCLQARGVHKAAREIQEIDSYDDHRSYLYGASEFEELLSISLELLLVIDLGIRAILQPCLLDL